ncbi:beta-ketoacyl synthase N-terminal-like domain-containing protein [Fluviicola taffensis]|uniref:Beta-ketoacyl-acyl-carrier-protein synthase I n=1 Tax=Fluviicola taffensis (strain DSM 16823 / NCIMB 13979 / RW262) TaxID=755732 RepID=F2IDQ8_FLUTR|nr:beta-ketoacyl synthase N-terminal-like domain-containing protein [Fluviicola taffensis]AEA43431.1 Beta-ketoacyl-acyl-carrier-protein synthase I [Fluviicola taffensis DSM 16823]
MDNPIYIQYAAIVSPLGNSIEQHVDAFQNGRSGIELIEKSGYQDTTLPLAKRKEITTNRYDNLLREALEQNTIQFSAKDLERTAVIVSSTKGNMDLLPNDTFTSTRAIVAEYFPGTTLTIISNACISGVIAINTAADLLLADKYDQIVVIGIDAISDFVSYGFQSLYALSNEGCKPFDKARNGTTLGEGCGVVVVSKKPIGNYSVVYKGGASSNDANHISGPSRTGEGLVRSIEKTFKRSQLNASDIDFISAHGTATIFNDEMESIAFGRTMLDKTPLNSMKGYFGHTLGAAGILETIMSIVSMEKNYLFANLGFSEMGTSVPLNIITKNTEANLTTVLKTASGFGGGNASLIIQKRA